VDTSKIASPLDTAPSSRRNFVKMAAAAGAGLVAAGALVPHKALAATDDPATIIGVALTAELLAVTFQTNAIANATTIGLTPAEVTTISAILATEAYHIRYLEAFGAVPAYPGYVVNAATQSVPFTFPTGTFSSRAHYANVAILLETAFVAAYLAATRAFAADARADLASLTFQIGAVEAEHRALSRAVGGYAPFSDVTFELNLLPNVAAGAGFLISQGFIPATGAAPNTETHLYNDALTTDALTKYGGLVTQTTP